MNKTKFILLFVLNLVFFVRTSFGSDELRFHEYELKAAFLYNFINFVEWPSHSFPDEGFPIGIGILGQSPLGEILPKADLRPLKGRDVVIKKLKHGDDIRGCNILFIPSSEKDHLKEILDKTRKRNILTVSDMKGFSQMGGIITFIQMNNQIRFELNLEAAQEAGLAISSKLLNLAIIVSGTSSHQMH